jgi:alkanesulfonate monooxygenase SsuD/methylene tetrahydromethanopterin reductase-like flavin-dependent oxidoreductase (luciferase family)
MTAVEGPRLVVRVPHAWCAASPAAILEVARAAEELGFWGISVQDHLIQSTDVVSCGERHAGGDDRTVYEAFQTLNWVAAATSTLRLVTAVVVLSYRHPVVFAKETATLDRLSGGRLVLGVGIGALTNQVRDAGQVMSPHARIAAREYQALGVAGHRGRQADEYLHVVDALWTGEPTTFHGEFVDFDELDLVPTPLQRPRPPILVGGRSPAALRRAALLADGWFPSQASVTVIAEGRRRMAEMAAEAGRPLVAQQGVNLFASLGAADASGEEIVADGLAHRFPRREDLLAATIAGDPDRFVARIEEYGAVGVGLFDLKLLPLGVDETIAQMRRLADEVMPRLVPAATAAPGADA